MAASRLLPSATIDGVLAVQKALAAPPGWPLNAPQVISVGVSAAANLAKIAGFEEGGYTGTGGRKAIAGVVHGQEFVVNADATARNRAALEAMNAGRDMPAAGGAVNNTYIYNNASDTTVREESRTNETGGRDLEVFIENVSARSVRRGGALAAAVEGTYGLNRSVSAQR